VRGKTGVHDQQPSVRGGDPPTGEVVLEPSLKAGDRGVERAETGVARPQQNVHPRQQLGRLDGDLDQLVDGRPEEPGEERHVLRSGDQEERQKGR
jgi:hypothetical protein